MSTAYRFEPAVSNTEFLAAAAELGYKPIPCKDTTDTSYLIGNEAKIVDHGFGVREMSCWVFIQDDGTVDFERYGLGSGDHLYEIADSLGVECLSEHDDGFFPEDTPETQAEQLHEPNAPDFRDTHAVELYAGDSEAVIKFKAAWDEIETAYHSIQASKED